MPLFINYVSWSSFLFLPFFQSLDLWCAAIPFRRSPSAKAQTHLSTSTSTMKTLANSSW